MKIAVVRSVFGNVDRVKPMPEQTVKADYYLFNESNSPYPLTHLNNRLRSRYFKCQTHRVESLKKYDAYLWIDGRIEIKSKDFIQYLLKHLVDNKCEITLCKHNVRSCIYEEAEVACLNKNYKDTPIKQEVEYYKKMGHPVNYGLWCCGMFLRLNNEKVNRCFDDWWDRLMTWTFFDQTSFPFVIRNHTIKLHSLPITLYNSDRLHVGEHIKK